MAVFEESHQTNSANSRLRQKLFGNSWFLAGFTQSMSNRPLSRRFEFLQASVNAIETDIKLTLQATTKQLTFERATAVKSNVSSRKEIIQAHDESGLRKDEFQLRTQTHKHSETGV